MSLLYLGALLGGLVGLALIDWRLRLCLFAREGRQRGSWALALALPVAVLLLIDVLAVAGGLFIDLGSPLTTRVMLPGGIPLEEPFFLALLSYSACILVAGFGRGQR